MYPLKANKRVSLRHREAAFMLTRIQARAQAGSSLEKREMVGQAECPGPERGLKEGGCSEGPGLLEVRPEQATGASGRGMKSEAEATREGKRVMKRFPFSLQSPHPTPPRANSSLLVDAASAFCGVCFPVGGNCTSCAIGSQSLRIPARGGRLYRSSRSLLPTPGELKVFLEAGWAVISHRPPAVNICSSC